MKIKILHPDDENVTDLSSWGHVPSENGMKKQLQVKLWYNTGNDFEKYDRYYLKRDDEERIRLRIVEGYGGWYLLDRYDNT